MNQYFVYIVTSGPYKTLYIGVTSDLTKKIWEHKNYICHGFAAKYHVSKLVYYEEFSEISEAILREKGSKNGIGNGSSI